MSDSLPDQSCGEGMCYAEPLKAACDHWKHEAEKARAELADQRRRLEPDSAGGFRWEAADLEAERDRLRAENEALKAENRLLCCVGDFSGHLENCSAPAGAPDCDCGYDEAMTQSRTAHRARLALDEQEATP